MEWLAIVKEMGNGPFKGIIVLLFIHAVRELSKMRKSLEKLTIKMAVNDEKIFSQDRRLRSLERSRA